MGINKIIALRPMTSGPPSRDATGLAMASDVTLLFLALILSSCGPSPLPNRWVEPRPLAQAKPTWLPPIDDTTTASNSTPPNPPSIPASLTLRDAIALTLLHSPELAAFGWNVRVAEARVVQAGLGPNPRVIYNRNNLDGPDGGDLFEHQTVRLSQVIELAAKRDKRVAVARATQRLRTWDYEDKRLELISKMAQSHISVIAAQQRLALAQRAVRLAENVYGIVSQRVEAGVAASAELDKAAVQSSLQHIGLARARERLIAERTKLVSIWGGHLATFTHAVGALDDPLDVPEPGRLLQLANEHPRIARWADEIKQRQRAIDLARAQATPDVTASAGVRHFPNADTDDVAALVEISVPLPLVKRNQGRILEARYQLAATRAKQKNAEALLHTEIRTAHSDLKSAIFTATTLRTQTLSSAHSAFDAAQNAFQNGKSDYLNVLDAERTLIEVERKLINARQDSQSAATRLESLTAAPLERRLD